ncbi:MAG: hypothetical protein M2R46_02559 [Verrucomicrobia subdivision 3 bacterium]|nr:hypothetical protein [Limisphaerales bacterium]
MKVDTRTDVKPNNPVFLDEREYDKRSGLHYRNSWPAVDALCG